MRRNLCVCRGFAEPEGCSREEGLEGGEQGKDVVGDDQAKDAADAAPDLAAEGSSTHLVHHRKRVQTELEPADRGRQSWLHIRIAPSCSHLVDLSVLFGHAAQVEEDFDGLLLLDVFWGVACQDNGGLLVAIA